MQNIRKKGGKSRKRSGGDCAAKMTKQQKKKEENAKDIYSAMQYLQNATRTIDKNPPPVLQNEEGNIMKSIEL